MASIFVLFKSVLQAHYLFELITFITYLLLSIIYTQTITRLLIILSNTSIWLDLVSTNLW